MSSNPKINGVLNISQDDKEVLNQIMANYLGLRTAYAAYEISMERKNVSSYNNRRLFWMAVGKFFSSQDISVLKLISHLTEFHRDFDCEIDSYMYPKHTCSLD